MNESKKLNLKALKKPKNIKQEDILKEKEPLKQENTQTNNIIKEKNESEKKQKFLVSLDDIKTMKEKESKKNKKEEPLKQEKNETIEEKKKIKKKEEKIETLFKNYSVDTEEEPSKEKTKKNKSPKKRIFISLTLLSILSLGVFYFLGYEKIDLNTIKSNILGIDTKKIESNTGLTKKNDEKTKEEIIKERIRQFLLKNYK